MMPVLHENGTVYRGTAAGAQGIARGEVVFNTSMTGYQEVLTDPSYAGQIVTMTSPQIGNYGVAPDDAESNAPKVAGFIMREESPVASNWRASGTLRDYLIANSVVAIADIDTRELTRLLRSSGVMRGVIATGDVDAGELVQQARAIPNMEGTDLVREVTCASAFDWPGNVDKTAALVRADLALAPQTRSKRPLRVAAYDFGIKWNILRRSRPMGARACGSGSDAGENAARLGFDGIFATVPAIRPRRLRDRDVKHLVEADKPILGSVRPSDSVSRGGKTFKLSSATAAQSSVSSRAAKSKSLQKITASRRPESLQPRGKGAHRTVRRGTARDES